MRLSRLKFNRVHRGKIFNRQNFLYDEAIMWRSHQPRFRPDLNRGLFRERVGVVISAPIRSYHVLMSILPIGLIVENFLAAKKFVPINTIASTIGIIASDRMTS